MRNLVVTDISIGESNIYQNEAFFDLRVSILYKLFVSEIIRGNFIIMLTRHLFISCS